MKVYNLFIAILLSLVFGTSCTNEEINEFQPNQKLQTKAIEKSIEVSDVAQLISMVEIDDEVMNEVKTGVENSCKYGLDEEYRFTDMLNPDESKISRSINIPILIQRMKAKYEELDLETLNSDFFDLLENIVYQFGQLIFENHYETDQYHKNQNDLHHTDSVFFLQKHFYMIHMTNLLFLIRPAFKKTKSPEPSVSQSPE